MKWFNGENRINLQNDERIRIAIDNCFSFCFVRLFPRIQTKRVLVVPMVFVYNSKFAFDQNAPIVSAQFGSSSDEWRESLDFKITIE